MPNALDISDSYIIFQLAGNYYGVPSRQVQQMEMVENVTPVPNAPPFVEGVVFLRGQVIPALNLRARFGFPKSAFDARTRLIVLQSGSRVVGLIVDNAREFLRIPSTAIQPPPETIAGLSSHYLDGIANIGERLILLIDAEAILQAPEHSLA